MVRSASGLGSVIISEAWLSFPGIGPQLDYIWGARLDQARNFLWQTEWVRLHALVHGLAIMWVVLGANSPLNRIRLDSSRVFLQQSLFDKGYADAVVDTAVAVDDSARTALVTLTLDPKWKTTVEDIVISGNEGVSARTIKDTFAPAREFAYPFMREA